MPDEKESEEALKMKLKIEQEGRVEKCRIQISQILQETKCSLVPLAIIEGSTLKTDIKIIPI